MLVNPTYNSASSVFYSLKQQGYRFSNVDTFDCEDSLQRIKVCYFTLTTPHGTSCLIRHAQYNSSYDGAFCDTFDVCGVGLPSGEYCRGEKFLLQRWMMLMKAAEKLANCSYVEYDEAH